MDVGANPATLTQQRPANKSESANPLRSVVVAKLCLADGAFTGVVKPGARADGARCRLTSSGRIRKCSAVVADTTFGERELRVAVHPV